MNLMPIAKYIQDNKLGELGKTLFINMMPIDLNLGILIRNPLVGTEIDYELIDYFNTEFQLIVRADTYIKGEDLMRQAMNVLNVQNKELDNLFFNFIRPRTEPIVFPLSDGNLLEFSVDFDVNFYKVQSGI